jgi:DNA-binding MarR family transcriptional regulator
MRAHQSGNDLALANGFKSFEDLVAVSRRIPEHDGREEFLAITPDGREFIWSEEDIEDLDAEEQRSGPFRSG